MLNSMKECCEFSMTRCLTAWRGICEFRMTNEICKTSSKSKIVRLKKSKSVFVLSTILAFCENAVRSDYDERLLQKTAIVLNTNVGF